MRTHGRRRFLSTLCGGALALAGCSMQNLYFLMPEDLNEPVLGSLVNPDKNKTNRVAMLVYCPLEVRSDFLEADRLLSEMLAHELKKYWSDNGDKVKLLKPQQIEMWKNSNPDWHSEDFSRIARALKVDYLIYIEIDHLSIYDKNTYSSYKGHVHGQVILYNARLDEEQHKTIELSYPSEARPILRDADTPASQFQGQFMKFLAGRLSNLFLPHHKRDKAYIEYNRSDGFDE
jgi:hypothetical protein